MSGRMKIPNKTKYASAAPSLRRQVTKRPAMGWSELEVYPAIRTEEAMTEETIVVVVATAMAMAVAVVVAEQWPRTWRRHAIVLRLRSVNLKIIMILVASCQIS